MNNPVLVPLLLSLGLGACASTAPKDKYSDSSIYKTHPHFIRITDSDLQQRPYEVLGEVSATVQTSPSSDNQAMPGQLSERMKEQASMLGADAIIFARFDAVDANELTQHELAGHGSAIRFVE
ncbi:hypothetical protein GCM10022278_24910 [Allohahella marinimesophila]|uniref:Uncharacterized protein n=1 Tax=Allohahella marinimesophila TaxID=1054972 RepID=A0ABP7PI52_9GAMM